MQVNRTVFHGDSFKLLLIFARLDFAFAYRRGFMGWKKRFLVGTFAGVLVSLAAAAQVPVQRIPGGPPGTVRVRQEPCWEIAGIPKSAMQQRRLIAQEARQQVESVCANASLSPTQKREEIRQIHERERQQIESLITPGQQEALRACQQERNHGSAPHPIGHAVGPCGEAAPPQRPHSSAEGQDNQKPQADEDRPQ
jgi:hypothetical protein